MQMKAPQQLVPSCSTVHSAIHCTIYCILPYCTFQFFKNKNGLLSLHADVEKHRKQADLYIHRTQIKSCKPQSFSKC